MDWTPQASNTQFLYTEWSEIYNALNKFILYKENWESKKQKLICMILKKKLLNRVLSIALKYKQLNTKWENIGNLS